MNLTTKIRDHNSGTTASLYSVQLPPELEKKIHEMVTFFVLRDCGLPKGADSIVFVNTKLSVEAYAEVFDKPSIAEMEESVRAYDKHGQPRKDAAPTVDPATPPGAHP